MCSIFHAALGINASQDRISQWLLGGVCGVSPLVVLLAHGHGKCVLCVSPIRVCTFVSVIMWPHLLGFALQGCENTRTALGLRAVYFEIRGFCICGACGAEVRPRHSNTVHSPKCEIQPKISRAQRIGARAPTVQNHRTIKGCMEIKFRTPGSRNIFRLLW